MKIKKLACARIFTLAALVAGTVSAYGSSMIFQPGEILAGNYATGAVNRYSANGTLIQSYAGTNAGDNALALTPDGNLVIASSGGISGSTVDIFSADGTRLRTFPLSNGTVVADVDIFPDGTIAVADGANQRIEFWSQLGVLQRTVNTGSVIAFTGSTIGPDGLLYVGGLNSFNVGKFRLDGTFLGTFPMGSNFSPFRPNDLVISPVDGTVWVAGTGVVGGFPDVIHHMTTSGGGDLNSFTLPAVGYASGIAFAPDHASLYIARLGENVIGRYDLNGNLLNTLNLNQSTPKRLVVVPNGLVPEPGTLFFLVSGTLLLAVRRRRSW